MQPIEQQPPLPADAWVSFRTAAERLDLSERQIRRYVAEGVIESRKLGRRCVRVSWASCLRLMEASP